MKILVTGATGTVGGDVARRLTGTSHQVRALVRDAQKAQGIPALSGVELIVGDLTDADDVRRALVGVDRAFLNMADDNGAAFAAVAREVGLEHVVLLSSFTATHDLPSGDANIVAARHRAGERALTEAGVPATFLRAAGFDYNVGMWIAAADDGVVRAPFPDAGLPIIDPTDIAAAAVAVLTQADPQPAAYSLTGPARVTLREQVQVLNDVLGRSLTVEENTPDDAHTRNFPAGTPSFVSTSVLETLSPAASVLDPSNDIEVLTGRVPRTFRDWAVDHASVLV